jgi:hypothetical protein
MPDEMSRKNLILILIYLVTAIFWLFSIWKSGYTESTAGYYFQIFLFAIPFTGALIGFNNAKLWGGFRSAVGKAILFLSLGTLTWAIGMLIWNYYIFIAKVEIPYPSLADVAFILSWPLWTLGFIELSKVTGAKFALRENKGKVLFVVIPLVVVAASYYLLITVARGGIIDWSSGGLKLFFDLFYPIGDVVILIVALMLYSLSFNFLGGKYKMAVLFLILAFVSNYFSDFLFSYTTTKETYFNGHLVDFLFATTMFILSLGLSMLDVNLLNKKS